MDRLQKERAQRFIDAANALTYQNRGMRHHAKENPDMQMLAAEIRALQVALDYLPEPGLDRVRLLKSYATAHRRIAILITDIAEREERHLLDRQGERVAGLV